MVVRVVIVIEDETKLLPFVIQHNVLSDVYFCDMRLCVVGLPHAEQSDLRPFAFIVILSIYTGLQVRVLACVCIYSNIGLHCSSSCKLQMIANGVRKAEKT